MDIPTLPVKLCHSHLIQFLVECWAVLQECRTAEKGRQAFGMAFREAFFFANPAESSSAPHSQILSPWSSWREVPIYSSTAEKNENPTPVQDHRCLSGLNLSSLVRRFCKELWGRQTTIANWRIHHASNICLLEDKIRERGMYLFTISCGSYAVDQRSGDGWFSGWFTVFVICKWNSNARFWSNSVRGLFQRATKSSIILTSKEESVWRTKGLEARPFPSRQIDCLLDLRTLPGHWSQRFCRELCWPVHDWSSKWRHSGIRWHLGRIV